MGIANQGVFGSWRKRVGNVVGRILQGQNVYSIYQPNVANPRTQAQQENRTKFTLIAKFMAVMTGFLRTSFAKLDGYAHGSAYSAAVGYNAKIDGIVSGVYPNYEIDPTKVILSEGSVDLPFNPSATAEGTTLTCTWADNSGRGNALADDSVMVVVYSKDENVAVYDVKLASRSERNGVLTLPSAWTGQSVDAWIAMRRDTTGECSISSYLGSFTL